MRVFSRFCTGEEASPPTPELYVEKPNGLEQVHSEEDLFRYTKHRWLFNEERELSKRYLKFDLQALVRVAVTACDGAHHCTRVTKCIEGLYNKAYILEMDNGSEVVAKLPNPNAGPARFTVASEVATRELLRVLEVPVPRILSWSCDAAGNTVGAEYIIEEKAPGVRLGSVWKQWPQKLKLQLITQVVDMEANLTSVTFDKHGCIYFKDDLLSFTGEAEEIHASAANNTLKGFAIGPLTTNELWNATRQNINMDRGPWKKPSDYTYAMGRNEMTWIKAHAIPRMNHARSSQSQETPGDGLALLEKYNSVSPYLVPPDDTSALSVLWHPDLHLDNIFVDPDSFQITRIIDWQSARVAPLFYQSAVPRMCRHPKPVSEGWAVPGRPTDYETLSPEEQKRIDEDVESETLHKYYEAQTAKRSSTHWAVLQQRSIPILRKPVWLVTGIWENRDLFFLRDGLMQLVAHWDQLVPGVPCPVSFSKDEVELQSKEDENINGVGQMLLMFAEQAVLPVDGMVEREDYEIARENCRKFRDIFINLGKNDEEKELFRNLWPYQDSESI
ncbi:kinase-like domain-containing protein [Aspergillus californicus]